MEQVCNTVMISREEYDKLDRIASELQDTCHKQAKRIKELEDVLCAANNLDKCPVCGGPADNGHDRCVPPTPYYCTKCMKALK